MNDEQRQCTHCNVYKDLTDFYICKDRMKSWCKRCTIKKNVSYQKKNKTWLDKYKKDPEAQKEYSRKYYAKNRETFKKYREDFKSKHPGYQNDYYRNVIKKRKGTD